MPLKKKTVEMSDKLASLFKDGISKDLYKLLRSKDDLNCGLIINVPDTVVYEFGLPISWYFTSKNGNLKKKNKINLLSAKIEEEFNKHALGYDVIAYFISIPFNEAINSDVTIDYFDRAKLNEFLYREKKTIMGFCSVLSSRKLLTMKLSVQYGHQSCASLNEQRMFINCMINDMDYMTDVSLMKAQNITTHLHR